LIIISSALIIPMAHVSDVLSAGDIARFSNLQVLAKGVVEGFCSGLHRSPHKGFSVEFKEHRSYVPGDDIRTVDWKLFGKTDRLYIREYEEETIFAARYCWTPAARWPIAAPAAMAAPSMTMQSERLPVWPI